MGSGQELQKVENIIVLVFVVDEHSHKICPYTKDTVVKSLTSIGFKPQRVIKGNVFSCMKYGYPHVPTAKPQTVES